MGYKKPIPVEINKIVIGKKYYTCSYSGTISVIILKIFKDTNSVLVKINSKKKESNPFVRHMNYIFIIQKWQNLLVELGNMMSVNVKRNRKRNRRKHKGDFCNGK